MYRLSFKCITVFFLSALSLASWGMSDKEYAEEILSKGLQTNDEFLAFLDARSCEFGIIPNCHRPLSLKDIAQLKDLFRRLESWKREAFDDLLPTHDKIRGRTFVIKHNRSHEIASGLGGITISLKHGDIRSETFIESILISAAIRMVMYDSFFRLSVPLSKAKKMRSILASDMGKEGELFKETFQVALDSRNWKRAEVDLKFLKESAIYRTNDDSFLEQYLEKSFTRAKITEKDFAYKIKNLLLINTILTHAELSDALEKIMGKISEFFGNSIGAIQVRSGKLKKLASHAPTMNRLKKKMKPLDILFEKTPFRLTDQFIPGFFGHVAIWLGTPAELMEMKVDFKGKEIPLLDHPRMLPFLERMSQGKLIVEALRKPGVTMNTFEHFLDVDDLVVVRPEYNGNPAERILKAVELVGRPYDFNFDVETENAIVCSELIYQIFDEFEWPIQREMGRYTISPDHVAWKAIDSCFEPVMMFHDGNEIVQNHQKELRKLLERRGGISYTPSSNCF